MSMCSSIVQARTKSARVFLDLGLRHFVGKFLREMAVVTSACANGLCRLAQSLRQECSLILACGILLENSHVKWLL